MKPISAKRAFEMGIPGLPLQNRGDSGGQGPEDAAISNRFFGGEDRDDHNSNSQPTDLHKKHDRPEDAAYDADKAANDYFRLLYGLKKVYPKKIAILIRGLQKL